MKNPQWSISSVSTSLQPEPATDPANVWRATCFPRDTKRVSDQLLSLAAYLLDGSSR